MPALGAVAALSQRILYVAYVGDIPERGLAGGLDRGSTLGAHVSTLDNYKVAPFASAAICCTVCRRVAATRGSDCCLGQELSTLATFVKLFLI